MLKIAGCLFAALPVLPLPAQLFVVDAAGGPGVNFQSIAAAVAAVPSGAVLDVRPGTYTGFAIAGKSLTVIGRPGVRVYDLAFPPIRIDLIARPDRVVLRGLELAHVSVIATIRCRNSSGEIVIDRCRSDLSTSLVGGRLALDGCADVQVRDSVFTSTGWFDSPLEVQRSNVTVTSSVISGHFAVPVAATASRLDFTDCTIQAGLLAPTVAIHQCHIDLRGGCTLIGSLAQGAILSGSGTADVDPGVTLQNAPAQPYSAGVAVTTAALPWLTAVPGAPGGMATATLSGSAALAALVIGAPGPAYLPAGATHPAWLLPGSEVVLAVGAPPLAGGYAVPNATWVYGVGLRWQGVAVSAGGSLELGNAVASGHF